VQVLALIDVLAALACGVIAVISSRYRQAKAAKPFVALYGLLALWALLEGLMLLLPAPIDLALWLLQHAAAVWIPLCWILATRAITATVVHKPLFWFTLSISLVICLTVLTNPWHYWVFARLEASGLWQLPVRTEGIGFYAYALFAYAVVTYGNYVLFKAWLQAKGIRRTELALWMICSLVTTLVDLIPEMFPTVWDSVFANARLTPAFFGFTASAIAWSYWRRISFRVQPVALEAAFQGLHDGILILDAVWRVSQLNPAAATLLGHNPRAIVGEPLEKWLPDLSSHPFGVPLERTLEHSQEHSQEHLQKDLQEHSTNQKVLEFTVSEVQGGGFVVMMRDLTALRDYQKQARRDGLTGLYNRRAFLELAGLRLERGTLEGTPTPSTQCLIYFDLDRFKPINDTYGHETGDAALVEVADRLCTVLECPEGIHNPVIARVGGDEFVALIPRSPEECSAIVIQLEGLMRQPMRLGAHTVSLGISWGMSVFPLEDRALEGLLRIADSKMYHRKRSRQVQQEV
jgi:diguanylate cyclase (GGDEF)-like protein